MAYKYASLPSSRTRTHILILIDNNLFYWNNSLRFQPSARKENNNILQLPRIKPHLT